MKLGRYEILEEVGRGGMGTVFRARSPEGGDLAIKLLSRPARADAAARFERERRLLASFGEAEGFVPLLDAGLAPAGPFLVMPFLPGGTLRARLSRGPLEIEETLELGKALAGALGRAHARGVVHRDLKPENVLYTSQGRPLLSDLGLAKHFDRLAPGASQSAALTATGEFRGTIGYAPREQLRDVKAAGPAADVFALGAVLYECLAGRAAFTGVTRLDVIGLVDEGVLEPLSRHRPDSPSWLVAAIERALSLEAADRFPDGLEFERALEAGGDGRPRRPWRWVALAILGVAALAGAILATRRPDPLESLQAKSNRADWNGVISEATQAIEREPSRAQLWSFRGAARGNKSDWDGMIADCTKAVELDPKLATAWCNRGFARGNEGDVDGEIADDTKAIELEPSRAESWVNRSAARAKKGDLDGAIADATRAIQVTPSYIEGWANRAAARLKRGDWKGAIEDYTKAIELDPRRADLRDDRGNARREEGDLGGAIQDFTTAIELDPKRADLRYDRGDARGKKGDWEGAIEDDTKAIELDPKLTLAWRDRGVARGKKTDWEGAIEDYTKAIELDPGRAELWGNRGFARGKKGDLDGRIEDCTKAIEIDPVRAWLWDGRAIARASKGDMEGAIADWTKAIELDPAFAPARGNRATARAEKGDRVGAIADFERFLEIAPDDPSVPSVREKLGALRAER